MIPFSKISFGEEEEDAVKKCMRSGWVVLGPKTREFEEAFADYVGAKYAVFVDSGTAALFLAIKGVNYDDFVTIPSFTFVSDAEVVHHAGLDIRFADIDLNTLCVEKLHDNLIPTCFSGNLPETARQVKIVDSCHRIEKDDVKGSDALWCYSFYATKNMSTVQGGMIALNDEEGYKWLKMARDHGATKGTKQRYSGKNPIYDVLFRGWRVKPDDLRASIGIEQLKKLPVLTEKREAIVSKYNKKLGINNTGNCLYPIMVMKREKFITEMHDSGVQTSVHFRPIHTLKAYRTHEFSLPNTEMVGASVVSLPLFPDMTDDDVNTVCKAVKKTKLLIN